MSPLSFTASTTTRSRRWCALLVLLGFVRREKARLGEVSGEGGEQRHDQDHLAEEARTHQVERDGLVGLARLGSGLLLICRQSSL